MYVLCILKLIVFDQDLMVNENIINLNLKV